MCRIGAIKSKKKLHPSIALKLMRSQQEGHDDSGFAFVMQDMGGLFENYKELPLLSMAATVEGTRLAEDILRDYKEAYTFNPEKTRAIDYHIEGCVGKTFSPEVHEEYLSGKHGHTVCYFSRRAAIQGWTKDTKETYFVISDVKQGIKYQIKLWS